MLIREFHREWHVKGMSLSSLRPRGQSYIVTCNDVLIGKAIVHESHSISGGTNGFRRFILTLEAAASHKRLAQEMAESVDGANTMILSNEDASIVIANSTCQCRVRLDFGAVGNKGELEDERCLLSLQGIDKTVQAYFLVCPGSELEGIVYDPDPEFLDWLESGGREVNSQRVS